MAARIEAVISRQMRQSQARARVKKWDVPSLVEIMAGSPQSPSIYALKGEAMCVEFSLTAQVVVRRYSHIVTADVRLVLLDEI